MALALGLGLFQLLARLVSCKPDHSPEGSLFNHSDKPNTSYSIDTSAGSIRYTTVRHVEPGEELCIFYGHHLWFTPAESSSTPSVIQEDAVDDGWGGLSSVGFPVLPRNPFSEGEPNEILPEDDLPFIRVKPPPQEEEMETIQTGIIIRGQPIFLSFKNSRSSSLGRRHPGSTTNRQYPQV